MRNHQRRWRFFGRYSGTQFFAEALHTITVFPRHERNIATLLFAAEPNTKLHCDKLGQFLERPCVDSTSKRYVLLYRTLRAGFDGSGSALGAIRWSYRSENSGRLRQIMTANRNENPHKKVRKFGVPFPDEISDTKITRIQMAEIAWPLYCFLMIPWRKILQGKAAFTDSPSSSASLVHLMLNFRGENAFRKAKLPRKSLCPHSTSAAQGISE